MTLLDVEVTTAPAQSSAGLTVRRLGKALGDAACGNVPGLVGLYYDRCNGSPAVVGERVGQLASSDRLTVCDSVMSSGIT